MDYVAKMDCVLLEDEALALKVIKDYVKKTPFLHLLNSFRNPLDALPFVMQHQPTLIIIDINMPDLSGMEFLDQLLYRPYVIFVTAYSDFAIQSFEHKTVDYLLKPVRFERFLKAANKTRELAISVSTEDNVPAPKRSNENFFFLKSGNVTHRIPYSTLKYIESDRNYVYYHKAQQKIVVKQTLLEVEKQLPADSFMRIHKSFIINLNHVKSVNYNGVQLEDELIPIGRTYRKALQLKLNML